MLAKMKPAALATRRASVFVKQQVGGAEDSSSQVSRQAPPIPAVEVFELRAWARAYLWAIGE
jgi:hypothetical protein